MSERPHGVCARGLGALRRKLLAWYDEHRRDLPWRRTRDPYAIWVSETMLQQTRVDTVIPYYERFLIRFPDFASLAEADLQDVYDSWTGLGYYSRARNLHAAARSVVDEHAGRLPADVATLRTLRGVGRYTAGALASIAYDREEPLVDGNVIRVLARLFDVRDDVGDKSVIERFWQIAGDLVRGPRPGDLNQALMELGATVCTPRAPRCGDCPVRVRCAAMKGGEPEALPRKQKRTRPRTVVSVGAWLTRAGRSLAVRRPEGGLLGGLWELPGGELADGEALEEGARRCVLEAVGLHVGSIECVGAIEHVFTHRRLELHVVRCSEPTGRVRRRGFVEHRWLPSAAIAALPHGGPTRKALAVLGEADASSHRSRIRATSASLA
jgi:A/G-specific adenine glycosylase